MLLGRGSLWWARLAGALHIGGKGGASRNVSVPIKAVALFDPTRLFWVLVRNRGAARGKLGPQIAAEKGAWIGRARVFFTAFPLK